jgi:thioredoxin-like negative regulator of GroEL
MEPLYASALALAGLANVVQMYKTAIERFMAHLTATSSWEAAGKTVT